MKNILLVHFFFICVIACAEDWSTPYEKGNGNQTTTYEACINYYMQLDKSYNSILVKEYGLTDIGEPLYLVIISKDEDFDPVSIHKKNKAVLLINNGIHPGEPEGIDASMMLARDLVLKKDSTDILDDVVVLIIPVYNVGGALNRNNYSRANQNGPETYGFRGNAKNLDLNRDYIKCDSRNAEAFTKIFREWNPHFFIDTHTSNGADYQHVMTLIATQHSKIHPLLEKYEQNKLVPELYKKMEASYPMCPYITSMYSTPDSGIIGFMDSPRYSTGYTTLFNTFGFVTETHMLKPFDKRVDATSKFLQASVELVYELKDSIIYLKKMADSLVVAQSNFPLDWELDLTKYDVIDFKGYEGISNKSKLTKLNYITYDKNKPFQKNVRFYDYYNPKNTITKPDGYIIPQAWSRVIELMELNKIEMSRFKKDTVMKVAVYYIEDYTTRKEPYEGHYLHYNVSVKTDTQDIQYFKGDYVIHTNQVSNRYIVETLEPTAPDSYFNWNFFDPILQRREGFSDYVFHNEAEKLVEENPDLKKEFYKFRGQNKEASNKELLEFIYENSKYHEISNKRYPITRLIK